jgi:hypothetical protein
MSGRPKQVDLGPIALPVGTTDAAWPDVPGREADAAYFRSLMKVPTSGPLANDSRSRGHVQSPQPVDAAPIEQDSLGAEIGRLLVGWGGHGPREVRASLRDDLFPDTMVRIYEGQGVLRVELTVGSPDLGAWLAFRLAALARDIGEPLDRAVGVWVFGKQQGHMLGCEFWSPGAR